MAKRNAVVAGAVAGITVVLVAAGLVYDNHRTGTDAQIVSTSTAPASTYEAPSVERPKTGAPFVEFVRPRDRPLSVLVAGDSLSNGTYAELGQGYRDLVMAQLNEGQTIPAREQRVGAAGEIAADAMDDLDAVTGPIDIVIVELGTNDVTKNDTPYFRTQYPALLDKIRAIAPDAAMVCAGPWNGGGTKTPALNKIVDSECAKHDGTFARLSSIYERGAPLVRGPEGSVTTDGRVRDIFHPNDEGHARIAEVIERKLQESGIGSA